MFQEDCGELLSAFEDNTKASMRFLEEILETQPSIYNEGEVQIIL